MIAEILDWLNHHWVLSIILLNTAVAFLLLWEDEVMKKERNHHD